jgi:hypothetical protein
MDQKSAVVQKMLAADCRTVRHGDHAQQLIQGPFHLPHQVGEASSRDERWARARLAQQGCRPLAHSQVHRREDLTQEPVQLVALEMAGCR